jgi:large subunit ribosomal protein L4
MADVAVLNAKRQEVARLTLPDAVYGREFNRHLLYESVRAYLASARAGTHSTKNRVDVSGGGKKPWKQKGTGRSRHGSTRSPLWRHGGTVFGPQPRDYSYAIPKRARRVALATALSDKLRAGKLVVVDAVSFAEPKTKNLQTLVQKDLGIAGKTLVVFDGENPALELAARNHPRIGAVRALQLHPYHVLDVDTVVISRAAAEQLGEVLGR